MVQTKVLVLAQTSLLNRDRDKIDGLRTGTITPSILVLSPLLWECRRVLEVNLQRPGEQVSMRAWAVIAAQRENLPDASYQTTSCLIPGLIEFLLLIMPVFLVDFSRSGSFDIIPRESLISEETFLTVGGKTLLKDKA